MGYSGGRTCAASILFNTCVFCGLHLACILVPAAFFMAGLHFAGTGGDIREKEGTVLVYGRVVARDKYNKPSSDGKSTETRYRLMLETARNSGMKPRVSVDNVAWDAYANHPEGSMVGFKVDKKKAYPDHKRSAEYRKGVAMEIGGVVMCSLCVVGFVVGLVKDCCVEHGRAARWIRDGRSGWEAFFGC